MKLLKAASHRWLVGDRVIGQRVVSALARGVHDFGNRNPGWYGAEEIPAITGSWRRISFQPIRQAAAALSRQLDFYGDRIFVRPRRDREPEDVGDLCLWRCQASSAYRRRVSGYGRV